MRENRTVKVALLILSLVLGGYLISYFWMANTLEDIKYLPMPVVIVSFGYVLMQMAKRALFSKKNWWDWLYYIGLIAIVLPTFLASEERLGLFEILTDYGSFFLIIPIFLDGKQMLESK